MLSSSSRSAPAASASATSAGFLHSTSILAPGRAARAAVTARRRPRASAMWFSLIRIASSSPRRWLAPPPAATAAFSSPRRPGVVLRVSRIVAPEPSTAATKRAVRVAIPDRWPRKLSAVRSPASRARAGPATSATSAGTRSRHSPSPTSGSNSWTPACSNVSRAAASPNTAPGCFCTIRPRAPAVAGTVASEVMSPAPTSSASDRATNSRRPSIRPSAGTPRSSP